MCQLRDNARTLAINEYRTNAQAKADQDAANKMEGKINVAIDLKESPEKAEKKKKKITGMLPNHFVTVQVANQNGADVSITMLTERNINKKCSRTVFVHVSANTFAYLHAKAISQITDCNITMPVPKQAVGLQGLSRMKKGKMNGKYRYKKPGTKRTKFFNAADDDDAKNKVIAFETDDADDMDETEDKPSTTSNIENADEIKEIEDSDFEC